MGEPSLIERLRIRSWKTRHKVDQVHFAKAASTLEDQARLIGECRGVLQAVMQERRGYFGLVDALLTKLKASVDIDAVLNTVDEPGE